MEDTNWNKEKAQARAALLPAQVKVRLFEGMDCCGYCGSPEHKLSQCRDPGSFEFPYSEIREFEGH